MLLKAVGVPFSCQGARNSSGRVVVLCRRSDASGTRKRKHSSAVALKAFSSDVVSLLSCDVRFVRVGRGRSDLKNNGMCLQATEAMVTSVVLNDDVVPRMSAQTIELLADQVRAHGYLAAQIMPHRTSSYHPMSQNTTLCKYQTNRSMS